MASSSTDFPLKVYICSIIGSTEIRKQVQRTLFILQSLNVPFRSIDITQRGNQEARTFMQENAVNKRHKGVPLPPQFFHNDEYIGNYADFEEAVEDNVLPEFLRLVPSATSQKETSEEPDEEEDVDEEEDEGEDEEGEEYEDHEDDEVSSEAAEEQAEDESGEEGEGDDEEHEDEEDKENDVTVTLARPIATDKVEDILKETSDEPDEEGDDEEYEEEEEDEEEVE